MDNSCASAHKQTWITWVGENVSDGLPSHQSKETRIIGSMDGTQSPWLDRETRIDIYQDVSPSSDWLDDGWISLSLDWKVWVNPHVRLVGGEAHMNNLGRGECLEWIAKSSIRRDKDHWINGQDSISTIGLWDDDWYPPRCISIIRLVG